MKRENAFWDASALLPLIVHEAASRRVRQLIRTHDVVAWWGSRVEIYSAIFRLLRNKQITNQEKEVALERLQSVRETWREMLPTDPLRDSAEALLGKHALRAADSFQLAAALVWCGGLPARRVFLCADERLTRAAREEGFRAVELPNL
jgi:uncharacterized protein